MSLWACEFVSCACIWYIILHRPWCRVSTHVPAFRSLSQKTLLFHARLISAKKKHVQTADKWFPTAQTGQITPRSGTVIFYASRSGACLCETSLHAEKHVYMCVCIYIHTHIHQRPKRDISRVADRRSEAVRDILPFYLRVSFTFFNGFPVVNWY